MKLYNYNKKGEQTTLWYEGEVVNEIPKLNGEGIFFFDGGRHEISNNEGICYHNTVCGGIKKHKSRLVITETQNKTQYKFYIEAIPEDTITM
jgi:hypothetical protein